VLGKLDKILVKYNGLSEQERAGKARRLWQKVRFGNEEVADLRDLRSRATYYTSLMTLLLNMRSSGSIGRVEQQMNDAGGQLREIKTIVNGIAALQISQGDHEGSILSTYTNDDRSAWKDLRRELRHKHGFRDSDLRKNKAVIIDYITELGNRGVLDDIDPQENDEQWHDFDSDSDAPTTIQADSVMSKASDGLPAIESEHFLDASVGLILQTSSAPTAQTPTELDRKLAPADPELTILLSLERGLPRATPVTMDHPENDSAKPHHAYIKTASDSDSDIETENREPSSGSCDIQGHQSESESLTNTATAHTNMSQKQSAQSSDQIRGSGKGAEKTEDIDEYEATSTTTESLRAKSITKDNKAVSDGPNPIPEISHSAGAMPGSKARNEMMSIQTDNGNANPKRVDAGIVEEEDDDDDDDPEYQRYRRKSASKQDSEACGRLGNKYYDQKRFTDAIEQYFLGMTLLHVLSVPLMADIWHLLLGIALEHESLVYRKNRAPAYMATGQTEKALKDLDILVSDIDPSNLKAIEMRDHACKEWELPLTELNVKDFIARSCAALDPEPSRPVKSPRSTAARSKGPGAELEKLRLKLERDFNEECELFIRSTPLCINTARIKHREREKI
jgi:tetratricopeptide (TPR) repeat protein